MSFNDLKNRGNSGIASYGKMLESLDGKSKFKDARLWELTKDSNKSGEAVIRFLPEGEGNDKVIVKGKAHSFNNPITKRWFIEQCPNTIGGKCPVCNEFFALKKEIGDRKPTKEEEDLLLKLRPRDEYFANIYVVNDIGNPANNGKVFVYKFGFSIWNKIKNAIAPDSKIEQPKDVFDMWKGHNFLLKMAKTKGPIPTYDESKFLEETPIGTSDDDRKKIYDNMFDLRDFISGEKIKTYQELEQNMKEVLGVDGPAKEEKKEVVNRGVETHSRSFEPTVKQNVKETVDVEPTIDDSIPYDKMAGGEVAVAEDASADEILKNFL